MSKVRLSSVGNTVKVTKLYAATENPFKKT